MDDARFAELRTKQAQLQTELAQVESEILALLAPTDDEDQRVTDSLLDQAHDCPEDVAENEANRIEELLQMREWDEEERAAEAVALERLATSAGDVPDERGAK